MAHTLYSPESQIYQTTSLFQPSLYYFSHDDVPSDRGYTPKVQILDNECPTALKKHFVSRNIDFQLVPPHLHRTNSAERAIATFKDHFIAGISSTDSSFPMHLWCRLIPLATTTLNLLRPSRLYPQISAEAALNGAFDYNKTPLPPPAQKSLHTNLHWCAKRGPPMTWMDGTSAVLLSTIDVTRYTSQRHTMSTSREPSNFSQSYTTCLLPHRPMLPSKPPKISPQLYPTHTQAHHLLPSVTSKSKLSSNSQKSLSSPLTYPG